MSVEQNPIDDFFYYEKNGVDDDGEATVSSKVALPGRLNKGKREIQDGQSESFTVDGLFTDHDRELTIGSLIQEKANDGSTTDIYQVVENQTTPSIDGMNTRYVSYLIRFKTQFPAIT